MCDHCACRTYPAIADLSAEHEDILALAWEVAEGRDRSGGMAVRLLQLLDHHIHKEERGLYPWLVQSGDLDEEQLDRLEEEHRTVRVRLVAGAFDRRDFYALAAHIEEEEMELFPSAMFGFDDDAWDALGELVTAT